MNKEQKNRLWQALMATAIDGIITPDGAVEAARDPANPLHPQFEWDDVVAGHRYRLDQARALIRVCQPTVEYIRVEQEQPTEVEVIVLHDPRVSAKTQAYVSSSDLIADCDASLDAVLLELRAVNSAVTRLARVASALDVDCPTDALEAEVMKLRARLEGSRSRAA